MSETAKAFGRTLAILGLAFGLLALLLSFVPVIGIIAAAPGVIAFIASIVAVILASKGNGPKGLSSVALAISALGLLIALIWGLLLYQATKKRDLPEQKSPEGTEMVQIRNGLLQQPQTGINSLYPEKRLKQGSAAPLRGAFFGRSR